MTSQQISFLHLGCSNNQPSIRPCKLKFPLCPQIILSFKAAEKLWSRGYDYTEWIKRWGIIHSSGQKLSRPWVPGQNPGPSPTCFSFTSKPKGKLPVCRQLQHLHPTNWTPLAIRATLCTNPLILCNIRESMKNRMQLHGGDQESRPREQTKGADQKRPQLLHET